MGRGCGPRSKSQLQCSQESLDKSLYASVSPSVKWEQRLWKCSPQGQASSPTPLATSEEGRSAKSHKLSREGIQGREWVLGKGGELSGLRGVGSSIPGTGRGNLLLQPGSPGPTPAEGAVGRGPD